MDALELGPLERAAGTVRLPGSKSISNRVLLLAALAQGETEIGGLLDADDTRVMRDALAALGINFSNRKMKGAGGVFPVRKAELFLGNAGTAFRPLTAALALCGGEYRVAGVPRMHERPIRDLVDALRGIGARIDYAGKDGFPPLFIGPGSICASTVKVRGDVSSQFLTALLMALPLTGRPATIEVEGELISRPYVEITLNVMRRFGVAVERDGWSRFLVPGTPYISPGKIMVEGDASSASYFLAAGALGGGPVRVQGVGRDSIQGDVRFTEVLERMGARVSFFQDSIEVRGSGKKLSALDMDLNHIPDAAMTAAVLALFADGPSTLRNIASWRVKETDRLAAMATELRKLGATVEEGKDFLKVVPGEIRPGVAIDTYDDHRMAMSFSLVSLGGVPVTINDPGCVAKTFPGYFDVFRSIAQGRTRDGPGSVPVIAIDGPSASGKGTIAKRVAQALGFHYLESGALYRLVALLALRHDLTDEAALARAVEHMDVVFQGDEILLEDQDVSQHIRHEAVGNRASEVARMPAVRQRLLTRQRAFRQPPGLVADGRDMATVVFPDAALKIFLTARPEIRAERRYKQLIEKGINANLRALSRDLAERDARDANRPVAPLVPAPDSQVLDSSALSVPAVVERILELCRERKLGGQGEHPA